jgi:hypothetical protein
MSLRIRNQENKNPYIDAIGEDFIEESFNEYQEDGNNNNSNKIPIRRESENHKKGNDNH